MRSLYNTLAAVLTVANAATTPTATTGFTSFSRGSTGFKTEPTFQVEKFDVSIFPLDQSQLAPGYLFLDPYLGARGWGPQIYTTDGTLVWHGPTRRRTQNLHVCDYIGEKGSHLCFSERHGARPMPESIYPVEGERPSSTYPWNLVLNQSYKSVGKPFKEGFDGLSFNVHAFESVNSGDSFVTLVARPKIVDLVPYGGSERGWVADQCFEEIDYQTRKSLFHWCYLDSELPVWSTDVFFTPSWEHWWSPRTSPNHTTGGAGNGDIDNPWDFIHLNAITKNAEGNYYLSVRHADMIVCIAGPQNHRGTQPGTILWKLGGKFNDFKLRGFPSLTAPFSKQHDVRPVSFSGEEEVISIFNNAFEGTVPASQSYSDAQIIRINAKTKQAELERSFPHPARKLTPGRGSAQVLENGNVLVSWGDLGELSEFSSDGKILYHATFEQANLQLDEHEFSYRAFKFPWIGKPLSDPSLVVQRLACNSTTLKRFQRPLLLAYVSWNGATEVRSWRLSTGAKRNGPWTEAGSFEKSGFETEADLTEAAVAAKVSALDLYVRAEAVDGDGLVIGSAVTKTELPLDWDCRQKSFQAIIGLSILVLLAETVTFIWQRVLCRKQSRVELDHIPLPLY